MIRSSAPVWVRVLFLGVGAAMLVSAVIVVLASDSPQRWVGAAALALLGTGGTLGGLLTADIYVAAEGLTRKRLLTSRRFDWEDITCVELNEVHSSGDSEARDCGMLRLYANGRKAATVMVNVDELDDEADHVLRRARRAFTDDRRSGEVSPPREGSPVDVRLRAREVVARAQRYHRGMGVFCLAMGLVPLVFAVAGVRLLLTGSGIGIVFLSMGVFGIGVAVVLARRTFAKGRRVRESLADYLD